MEKAVNLFRVRTEENYISRHRLEELATNFKDRIYQDVIDSVSDDETTDFFVNYCEMENHELTFFGLESMIDEEE